MIVMVCVDDKNGMMFNKRRQSQDRVLRQHMLELAGDKKLWMNAYSRKQFPKEDESRIAVAENGFQNIRSGEYCFLEDKDPAQYKEQIEELILFSVECAATVPDSQCPCTWGTCCIRRRVCLRGILCGRRVSPWGCRTSGRGW